MPNSSTVIFDGHNDVLLVLPDRGTDFFERGAEGHIDLPRAVEGGLGGGLCAVYVSSRQAVHHSTDEAVRASLREASDPSAMPPTPEQPAALRKAMEMAARLFRLEEASNGAMQVVRTAAQLADCLQRGVFAAVFHIEGAEAIDPELNALEVFHRAGLRSLGPVWSRPNIFGEGVPMTFGLTPDTGPGLTDLGKDLVRACNRLRIMVDLAHLNMRGFWDVAALSNAPLVASHSNAWALCHSPRNLQDDQLDAVAQSGGLVGVNFHVGFLREDGQMVPETPLEEIVRHVEYLVERMGIDHVGFGSDFDGALISHLLPDASGLPKLVTMLCERGFGDEDVAKLTHGNWVRVLRATWGE